MTCLLTPAPHLRVFQLLIDYQGCGSSAPKGSPGPAVPSDAVGHQPSKVCRRQSFPRPPPPKFFETLSPPHVAGYKRDLAARVVGAVDCSLSLLLHALGLEDKALGVFGVKVARGVGRFCAWLTAAKTAAVIGMGSWEPVRPLRHTHRIPPARGVRTSADILLCL